MLCMCKITIHTPTRTQTNRNTTNKLHNIKNKIKVQIFKIILVTNHKLFFKLHIYSFCILL